MPVYQICAYNKYLQYCNAHTKVTRVQSRNCRPPLPAKKWGGSPFWCAGRQDKCLIRVTFLKRSRRWRCCGRKRVVITSSMGSNAGPDVMDESRRPAPSPSPHRLSKYAKVGLPCGNQGIRIIFLCSSPCISAQYISKIYPDEFNWYRACNVIMLSSGDLPWLSGIPKHDIKLT